MKKVLDKVSIVCLVGIALLSLADGFSANGFEKSIDSLLMAYLALRVAWVDYKDLKEIK